MRIEHGFLLESKKKKEKEKKATIEVIFKKEMGNKLAVFVSISFFSILRLFIIDNSTSNLRCN